MKFLADEHIDLPAVKALKRLSIDIISIQDANMNSCSDEEILSYGCEDKRAIITQDSDFLRLNARNTENSGIIFLTKPLDMSKIYP